MILLSDLQNKTTKRADKAVASDCVNTGLTEGKHCSTCGEVLVAQTVVDALGHTEVIDAAIAANCTNTGLTEVSIVLYSVTQNELKSI